MALRIPVRPLVLSALLVSCAVAIAWTDPNPVERSAPAETVGIGEGDDLEDIMHGIDKNYEAALVAIEKKDASTAMQLMSKLQQGCIGAKVLTPPKLRTIEEKDKAAFVAGYRKEMLELLKLTADLEMSLVDNDFEKAKKITEQIDEQKNKSHNLYKKMPRKKKE